MSILRIEVFGTNYTYSIVCLEQETILHLCLNAGCGQGVTHLVTNTFRSVWEYVGVQQYCLPNDKYSVDKTVHHGGTIGG